MRRSKRRPPTSESGIPLVYPVGATSDDEVCESGHTPRRGVGLRCPHAAPRRDRRLDYYGQRRRVLPRADGIVRAIAGSGAGFLLAVLWFDLMFDVQARGHTASDVPADVRASIAAYYARVTTAARPMNRLVPLVMVTTIAAQVAE